MVKILQVTTVSSTIQAFLLPFAKAFKSEGWIVDAAGRNINDYQDVVDEHRFSFHVEFSRDPFDLLNIFQSFRSVRKIINNNQYDIVHVHTPIAAFITRLSAIGLKNTKVYYTAHGFHYSEGNGFLKNLFFLFFEKIAGYFTEHLFVINTDDYNFSKKFKIVPEHKLTYIPGIGVDCEHFSFDISSRDYLRENLEIERDEVVFLHIAELNTNKNHSIILDALSIINDRTPDYNFKYLIVGHGVLHDDLVEKVKNLGLCHRVQFLGYRKDIRNLLSASDVLCLSSFREGLPRCILEAMSAKLPIIASDIRGCRDLLSKGGGVLVSPYEINGWLDAFQYFSLRKNRTNAGDFGYSLVTEKYNIETVLSDVISVYKDTALEKNS
ncbi:glycosyltransferase family 4 protein [Vibrio lentus]